MTKRHAARPKFAPGRDTSRQSRVGIHGFTLIELLVTMTGAIIVSITLFTLARFTTKVHQGESHVATATLGNIIGFERLRADIARAGNMASPHVRRDPFICGEPVAGGWPNQLGAMTSIRVEQTPLTQLPDLFAGNGLAPQELTLAGNFLTSSSFAVAVINHVGTSYQVVLQQNQRALADVGYFAGGADRAAVLSSVFPAGRAVRIVDETGKHHYATIRGVSVVAAPTVVLEDSKPALQETGGALGCGIDMGSTGLVRTEINPVQFIRYRIGDLRGVARFAPVYAGGPGPDYEADRTELIREELDVDGAPIAGTQELIAEYAVDLHFGLTVAPTTETSLQYIGRNALAGWVGDPTAAGGISAGQGPQLVRAVNAAFSVRSFDADRLSDIPRPNDSVRYRIGLATDGSGGPPFARVITSQARISIPNHERQNWQ